MTDRKEFTKAAEKSLRLFSDRAEKIPQATPYLLLAVDFWSEEPKRVVLAGQVGSADGQALLRAAHAVYQPGKVVLATEGAVEPFAKTLKAKDGKPTAYLCTGTACQPPTHDAANIRAFLK